MASKRVIAVVGATGAQGGGLARAILADPVGGFAVRALTRHAQSDKAKSPAAAGAEVVSADLDDEGTIDLLEWTAELFIYTSSSCLVGRRFRAELTARVAQLFGDLEQGTDPIAFVDPYADIESFRRRDAARAEVYPRRLYSPRGKHHRPQRAYR